MKSLPQLESLYRRSLNYQFSLRELMPLQRTSKRKKDLIGQLSDSCTYCTELRDEIEKTKLEQPRGYKLDRKKEIIKLIEELKEELKTLK